MTPNSRHLATWQREVGQCAYEVLSKEVVQQDTNNTQSLLHIRHVSTVAIYVHSSTLMS